jgi:MFS family permease
MHGTTAAQEWRRGGTLVLAAAVGFSFHSVMSSSTGIFMQPLGAEFGWDRTQLSSGISIAGVLSAVLSPFFGVLIDRWGTRRIALPGLIATGTIVSCFAFLTGSFTQWIILWCVYGLISMSVKSTVWSIAVAGAFSSARGLALGLTMAGAAVAQTITPPLANWLITDFGWRWAFVGLGAGWATIAFLVCVPFLRDFRFEARAKAAARGEAAEHELTGLSVREAWRSLALWRIAISTFVMMTLTIGLLVHQFPILVEAGVSRATAAWLASLAGLAGIAGKLLTGALMDRYAPNWVGGLTLGATAFAFGLLMEPLRTPVLIVIAMVINGYASGAKLQICVHLTSQFAGLRNFGKIFGVMAALIAGGSSVGPVLAGWIHDSTADYAAFLLAGVAGSLLSGLLIVSLPRHPSWEARSGGPTATPARA